MPTIEIDNRGLEPPEPMVNILRALQSLGEGDDLLALMDREPVFLYPELERRGYSWDLVPRNAYFLLAIRRETP